MINITPEARDLLKDMLDQVSEDQEVGIRLVLAVPPGSEGGEEGEVAIGLMLDQPHEEDQIIEHSGRRILILDPSMAQLLEDDSLEAVETDQGRSLTVNQKAA